MISEDRGVAIDGIGIAEQIEAAARVAADTSRKSRRERMRGIDIADVRLIALSLTSPGGNRDAARRDPHQIIHNIPFREQLA
jgi:hypothetical protein